VVLLKDLREYNYTYCMAQASLMTHQQLDLVLLGSLMTTLHDHDETLACGRHKPAKRQIVSSHFMHNDYKVCMDTFGFLHGIGKSRIKAMKKHYRENSGWSHVYTRTPGDCHKMLRHIVRLVKFMENYTEANAILLPGRIAGYKRDDLKPFPSDLSKCHI